MARTPRPPAVPIRAASPADAPALVALVERCYRGATSRRGWTTEADLLAGQRTDLHEVSAILADGRAWVLLAEFDGELIGCVRLSSMVDDLAELSMFAIEPDWQRRGLGRALLRAAEQSARARGAHWLRLQVIAQRSELIAWYERRGFALSAEVQPFPYGQPRYGLPLRDDLYFRTMVKQL